MTINCSTVRIAPGRGFCAALSGGVVFAMLLAGCGSGSGSGDGGDAAKTDLDAGAAAGGKDGRGGQGGTAAGGSDVGGASPDATGGSGQGGARAISDGGATDVPTGPPPAGALDLCRTFCERVTKCDTSRDQQTCVNACTNSNAALFPKLRADIVASIATCVAQKDCATISQDVSLRTCAVEAAAVIGPSATATALCTATDTAQAQCGVTIDKADCLTTTKIYSDATLTEAMACTAKSCSLIFACASATLNGAVGSWSLGGGIHPGKKCAGSAIQCSSLGYQMTSCQAAGCTYAATCTGSPYCSALYTMATCQAVTGCAWSGTSCSGTATLQCASLTTATACSQVFGCFASGSCTGTVPACTTLGVTTCMAHPGCMVMDAM